MKPFEELLSPACNRELTTLIKSAHHIQKSYPELKELNIFELLSACISILKNNTDIEPEFIETLDNILPFISAIIDNNKIKDDSIQDDSNDNKVIIPKLTFTVNFDEEKL